MRAATFCFWLALLPLAAGAQMKEGDYLAVDYMEAIVRTRSPLRSADPSRPPLYVVRGQGPAATLLEVWNFHEGREFGLRPNGETFVLPGAGFETGDSPILAIASDGFVVRSSASVSEPTAYRYVGSAQQWVMELTVAGTYRAVTGQRVVFRATGKSRVLGALATCEVGLDVILEQTDHVVCDGRRYAFERRSDRMKLYRFPSKSGKSREKQPFFVGFRVAEGKSEPEMKP